MDDITTLARYLNEISETDIHYDNMSEKVQRIYQKRAQQIMLFFFDQGWLEMIKDEALRDAYYAGWCDSYVHNGVEEDWLEECFIAYKTKMIEKIVKIRPKTT